VNALSALPPKLRLVRITAGHFVAGIETDGMVRRAAPILRYMLGWQDARVELYCDARGWAMQEVVDVQAKKLDWDLDDANLWK